MVADEESGGLDYILYVDALDMYLMLLSESVRYLEEHVLCRGENECRRRHVQSK